MKEGEGWEVKRKCKSMFMEDCFKEYTWRDSKRRKVLRVGVISLKVCCGLVN